MSDKWKGGWLLNNNTKQHSAVEQSLPVCSCHQNHFVHLFRFKLETTYMEKTLTLWSIVVSLQQVFFLGHKELVFTLHSSSTPRLDTTAGPSQWDPKTSQLSFKDHPHSMTYSCRSNDGRHELTERFPSLFQFYLYFLYQYTTFCLQYIKKTFSLTILSTKM